MREKISFWMTALLISAALSAISPKSWGQATSGILSGGAGTGSELLPAGRRSGTTGGGHCGSADRRHNYCGGGRGREPGAIAGTAPQRAQFYRSDYTGYDGQHAPQPKKLQHRKLRLRKAVDGGRRAVRRQQLYARRHGHERDL